MLRPRSQKDSSARAVALVAILALLACTPLLTFEARAKQKNKKNQQPTTGRIEISTNPGGYPITIDGQPAGETTDYVRQTELDPCPSPVNVTAPAAVNDGDVVTFSADIGYTGQSALNYTWTVSPPAARILSGAGTPTITVDSSGLGNHRVTAILVVDDGSGDRSCRQTAQAATGVNGLPKIETSKR